MAHYEIVATVENELKQTQCTRYLKQLGKRCRCVPSASKERIIIIAMNVANFGNYNALAKQSIFLGQSSVSFALS